MINNLNKTTAQNRFCKFPCGSQLSGTIFFFLFSLHFNKKKQKGRWVPNLVQETTRAARSERSLEELSSLRQDTD